MFRAGDGDDARAATTALLVVCCMFAPFAVYRAIRAGTDTPSLGTDTLSGMTFNNEQGYDTERYLNGECYTRLVTKHYADVVAISCHAHELRAAGQRGLRRCAYLSF